MTLVAGAPARRWARGTGLVAAVVLAMAGGVYAVVHAMAGDHYGPEGWPQHLAFGLPLMAAGVIALLGSLAGSPWLLVIGGAAAVPISLVSFVGMPAAIPATVAIIVGAGSLRSVSVPDWAVGSAITALLVGAFGYEILHQDPAEWTTPSGGAASSNVITMTESVVVYVAVALALAAGVAYLVKAGVSRR